ncbi:helix-turn-helix domain-containing protein [Microcoleus sp. herbarium19]|uniref:helix-turn-helix domain-containing protein n=1 Tax=Microcoleus sp. herbarium19 TaxID=3055440 RepID=UPI002FCF95BF
MIKYRINLLPQERIELLAKVQKGKSKTRTVQKAHVILASDETLERQSETSIAATYYLSVRSVERIRKDFCERGMAVFEPKPRQPRSDKKLTGEVEAHLIAIVCGEPPAGESRWKLQAIADRLVELNVVESLSHTSVATVLKKTS